MQHIIRSISLMLAIAIIVGMFPVHLNAQADMLTETAEVPTIQASESVLTAADSTESEEILSESTVPDESFSTQNDDGTTVYFYTLDNDNNAIITGYTGSETALSIPSALDGNPVIAIGSDVFKNLMTLQTVVVPEGVTTIGAGAFAYCISLNQIILPASLEVLGGHDGNMYYSATGEFQGCTALEYIGLPEGLTYLGDATFYGCSALKEMDLPSSLETLGEYAFTNTTFESIEIPASVQTACYVEK